MRVVSLGSGSSGNALLIEAGPRGRTKILVDAGFSARVLAERLRVVDVTPGQLRGILVTHEHADHILGLPVLAKRHNLPVITDPRTFNAIAELIEQDVLRSDSGKLVAPESEREQLARSNLFSFDVGARQSLGDIEVTSFPVSHDAAAPCGYLLHAGGCRVCVVTDTGEVTPTMLEAIAQADLLVLESNHDRERLLRGPYPYHLKMRILSATGHLSNDQAAEAVLRTWRGDGVRWLWLSHLSRTNNTPGLALSHMRSRIQQIGANLAQMHISILPPGMGPIWDSTKLWHSSSLWEMEQ